MAEFGDIGSGLSDFCYLPWYVVIVVVTFTSLTGFHKVKWCALMYLKAEWIKTAGELKRDKIL